MLENSGKAQWSIIFLHQLTNCYFYLYTHNDRLSSIYYMHFDDIVSDNIMNMRISSSLTQARNSLIVPHFSFH